MTMLAESSDLKVAIITSREWAGLYLSSELIRSGINVVAVLMEDGGDSDAFLNLRQFKANARRLGLKQSIWLAIGFPMGIGYAVRRLFSPREYPLPSDIRRLKVSVHRVAEVKSAHCHELLSAVAPDVTVICGTPILPGSLLSIARICTLNIHTSLMPHYRGGGSLFWPLFFRDTDKVGFTIHEAVAAVDAGPYLYQERVPVRSGDTPELLLRRCFHLAVPNLVRILKKKSFERLRFERPVNYAWRRAHPVVRRYWFGPTLRQRLSQLTKHAAYATGVYPFRSIRKGIGAAFYFHRGLPDDTPASDWRRILGHPTVSEIRDKLVYLRRYFELVPLTQYVEMMCAGKPLRNNIAAVTVDDGYQDFCTNILPLLEELGIPATLFVCSGAVETGAVWYQQVYNLIDGIRHDRLVVPWMDTSIYFGETRQRVLTVEYVLLPYLKKLPRARRLQEMNALFGANNYVPTANDKDSFCTVEQLRSMRDSKLVELHCHGHSHDPFQTLSDVELEADLKACREFFEHRLGINSAFLSFPNGSFSEKQRPIFVRNNLRACFSTRCGWDAPTGSDALALHRIGFGNESMADFSWSIRKLLQGSG